MITAAIPLPIQIVIDDVGWWCGENGSARQEPYRTGIKRNHVLADYEALISLGKQLNMRPQAAFIACEWDKYNILRDLPSSTWMGKSWDNSRWVGEWQEEAADLLRRNRDHFELTLHGVGHEFWAEENGDWRFTRAEWCDTSGNMRPRHEVQARFDYFQRLLDQHSLGVFPTSFVPCAFSYRFATDGSGLARMLRRVGIRFVSTPVSDMHNAGRFQHRYFGYDDGVMTVDRGMDLLRWFAIGATPSGAIEGPICGMHWPNILHEDPERNEEIVQAWVEFLRPYDQRIDRMLAPNTDAFASQLAHHECTTMQVADNKIEFDFQESIKLPDSIAHSVFVLKLESSVPLQFTASGVEIMTVEETKGIYKLALRKPATIQSGSIEYRPKL